MQVLTERDRALQRSLHFLFNFLWEIPSVKKREKINQHFLLHYSLEGTSLFSGLLQMEGVLTEGELAEIPSSFLAATDINEMRG